jgi:uncharacterized protein
MLDGTIAPNSMEDAVILDSPLEAHPDPPHDASILKLSIFLALAFLISWTLWFVAIRMAGIGIRLIVFSKTLAFPWTSLFITLGTAGPGVSAIILILASRRRDVQIHSLLKSLTNLHDGWRWYALAVGIVPVVYVLSVFFYIKIGGKIIAPISPASWLQVFVFNLPFSSLWEEIGWRGYLLPRLIRRYNNFVASIIIGVISAVWMCPFYGILSNSASRQQWISFQFFALISTAMSVIYTCVYLGTKGSLIPVVLLHSSALASAMTLIHALPTGERLPFIVSSSALWVVALIVHGLAERSQNTTRIDRSPFASG